MNAITNSLPVWARPKVAQLIESKTSPIEGAEAHDVSALDAKAFEALILDQATRMTEGDQQAGDHDERPNFIKREVFSSGLTEDIHFRRDEQSLEVAYDFGNGYHAQYLQNDENTAVYLDIAQGEHNHNMAVFVDKHNPANSVLFAKEL